MAIKKFVATFHVAVRPAEEGGFWAEVLELPGCVSQGETKAELLTNIIEAIEACVDDKYYAEVVGMKEETPTPEAWNVPVPLTA